MADQGLAGWDDLARTCVPSTNAKKKPIYARRFGVWRCRRVAMLISVTCFICFVSCVAAYGCARAYLRVLISLSLRRVAWFTCALCDTKLGAWQKQFDWIDSVTISGSPPLPCPAAAIAEGVNSRTCCSCLIRTKKPTASN